MSTNLRSRSRSKRSTTNLSNLRLAPLSAKFADEDAPQPTVKTPSELASSSIRSHPSYLQGRSAPTTPGILSRSSSRKRLAVGGGLSRKNSLYDTGDNDPDDAEDESAGYVYNGARTGRRRRSADPSIILPKAHSEATLLAKAPHSPTTRYKYPSRRPRTGASTPALATATDESWLSHAGATASALVQEGKGQSWLASRDVAVKPTIESEEGEEYDDQYEEMAALSASTAQLHFAAFEGGSPVSARVSRWGSRYGSRNASRRTSRRGSPTGMRTPRQGDGGYFDDAAAAKNDDDVARFDGHESESEVSEIGIEDLGEGSFGLGPLVESFLGFNPFRGEEGVESTDEGEEGEAEAMKRRDEELKRRRDAKAQLLANPPPAPLGEGKNGEGEGDGWSDAAWLLSVATKAMF